MQVWCFNNVYVFFYLIIALDLLVIGAGVIKLMTNWQEKKSCRYKKKGSKSSKYIARSYGQN